MRVLAAVMLTGLLLASCGGSSPQPAAVATAAPAELQQLPATDFAAAQALLGPDQPIEVLDLAATGPTIVAGTVQGYAAPAYAVTVAAGQTLSVTFAPSNANLYFNVLDGHDRSGAAVHRGEADGPVASIVAPADTTYVIAPFQPRATARRNESGTFTLTVSRN